MRSPEGEMDQSVWLRGANMTGRPLAPPSEGRSGSRPPRRGTHKQPFERSVERCDQVDDRYLKTCGHLRAGSSIDRSPA
jgi:hypothetical protein